MGFPGETDAEFAETLEVAEQVGYDSAFTFIFSPRRATTAADLADQIPHEVKRERMERLLEVVQRRAPRALAAIRGPDDGGAGGGHVAHRRGRVCADGPGTTRP